MIQSSEKLIAYLILNATHLIGFGMRFSIKTMLIAILAAGLTINFAVRCYSVAKFRKTAVVRKMLLKFFLVSKSVDKRRDLEGYTIEWERARQGEVNLAHQCDELVKAIESFDKEL